MSDVTRLPTEEKGLTLRRTHQAAPGTPGGLAEQPRWRNDFPIDQPQDIYVARRDFTKLLTLN